MKLFPMTDIAMSLTGPQGAVALKTQKANLDAFTQEVKQRIRKGLDKEQFEVAQLEMKALQSAQMILDAVHKVHRQ